MMPLPKIIIVTGLPASGKTWLATEISKELSIPLFSKDDFKIELLKSFGKKDRDWDRQIGIAAIRLQISAAEAILRKSFPVILESNFKEEFDGPLLHGLMEKTGSKCFQINCGAAGEILIQRFNERESKPERSQFHFPGNMDEFAKVLRKGFEPPLNLPGEIVTVDTSEFEKVDLKAIVNSLKKFLKN